MPRVPTAQGPQVQERALQGGFDQTAPVERAFTGDQTLMRAAEQASQQIARSADRIAERNAHETAWRVETALQSEFLEWQDQQRRSRQGAHARGYAGETAQWWQEKISEYEVDLPPEARAIVSRSLANARLQSTASAYRWEAAEIERAEKAAYSAAQSNEVQRAALTGDPAMAAAAVDQLRQRVFQHGAINNWDGDQVEKEIRDWTSQLHSRMLDTLVDVSPGDARNYFKQHRSDIDASLHVRIERTLKDAETTQEARMRVDEMSHLPLSDQLDRIRDIGNDDVRKKARDFARQDAADRQVSDAQVQRDASNDVWQRIANGAAMEQLPPSVLAQMSGKDRIQVNKYYEAMAEAKRRAALGLDIQTDPEVYNALLDESVSNPAGFANADLDRYRFQLSNADFNRLRGIQRKMQEPKNAQTYQQLLSTFFRENNLQGTTKRRVTERGEIETWFFNEVDEFITENKREPTREEQQRILDRINARRTGIFGTRFGGRTWREVRGDPEAEAEFRENIIVPEDQRNRIIRRWQERQGTTPTDEQIRQAYLSFIGLDE